jgi:hypothetical protein
VTRHIVHSLSALDDADMSGTNTLRRSGAMFSERYGVPGDVNHYQWIERCVGESDGSKPETT